MPYGLGMVHTRDMNKQKRAALIDNLTTDTAKGRTADDFVVIATRMADSASQGRTDRWKGASTFAGRAILRANRDLLTVDFTRQKVELGLQAMTNANK